MADEDAVEVVVVGAGYAGLAAAQLLGRAQRRVRVLGSGPTRNAEAEHAHNVLTRDGTPPGDLLRMGIDEVTALPTVTFEDVHVDAVERAADGRLGVRAGDRVVRAEVVLLATGARDTLPDVAGLTGLWGRRAHSCPFCDAEPYTGRRLIVLAEEGPAAHSRALLAGWTDRLTVVDPGAVTRLEEQGDVVVAHMTDGAEVVADGVFVGVTPVPRLDCVAGMDLARRGPFLAVDGEGRTSQPGLWAAGDCAWKDGDANPGGQVIGAMAAGARAAAFITIDRLGVHLPPPPPVTPSVSTGGQDHLDGAGLQEFWEQRYAEQDRIWSGRPNQRLADEVADLSPGTALDLGCGEGADAVWLAEQGWQVTAVDVSSTALERATAAAAERGVADRITVERHDLGTSFPAGEYGLVAASYLLSPVTIPRTDILRTAAKAVAPGGTLLILGHTGFPSGHDHPDPAVVFLSPEEEVAALDLPESEWTVQAAETFERAFTDRDGTESLRTDTVVRLDRTGAG